MNQRLLKNGENINSQDITLFCFPFAGGGASAYNSWVQKMRQNNCLSDPATGQGRKDYGKAVS